MPVFVGDVLLSSRTESENYLPVQQVLWDWWAHGVSRVPSDLWAHRALRAGLELQAPEEMRVGQVLLVPLDLWVRQVAVFFCLFARLWFSYDVADS
jgi:hypothetical protein